MEYVNSIMDTLSSPSMHGRGYVNNGDRVAAEYIQQEFEKSNLLSFGGNYQQKFPISINTFPDTIDVSIDDEKLKPGYDYVLFSSSPSVSGKFELVWYLIDSTGVPVIMPEYANADLSENVLVTDVNQRKFAKTESPECKGVVFLMDDKVWWHVSNGSNVEDQFALQVVKNKISSSAQTISIQAENAFYESYSTQNVIAYIKGKTMPNQFIVFSAHYDHLGQMGPETFFPGANDNASGVSMMLDLARYYSKPENQPDYSIAFMAFGAEEVGLMGSGFNADNPLFPLADIQFLINLDMVGSGSEGIKVVNGTVFKDEFDRLVQLNEKHNYLLKVSERGEAANSDHYPFYAKGVPCFFIYTLGDECKEYHNIYDTPENVPFTEYVDFFNLLTDFVSTF